jgi:hypothetical protein
MSEQKYCKCNGAKFVTNELVETDTAGHRNYIVRCKECGGIFGSSWWMKVPIKS